jgi:neutral amino acid transport system permease protein
VKFGLIIAMAAIGLSLIFGTTGLINFAHAELVTFGAVAAWYLNTSGPQLHIVFAGAIAIAITALIGGGLEVGLWRPLRHRRTGLFQMLVITIGLSLFARHIILLFFGGRSKPYIDYRVQQGIEIGPVTITPRDLIVMGLSVLVLVLVATLLQRSRLGKATRAVADNLDLAESSGIDVERIIVVVWIVGAGLAATGGIFLGLVTSVSWNMGFQLLLLMFAAIILGGLGNAYGAMVGGIVVGLVTEVSTVWISSELKTATALLVLILVLLFRPQGILGTRERIG